MKPRSRFLLDKSLGAMLAALEIYNKPVFSYREETFAILAVNAWELLLKARILQLASNKISSILVYENRTKLDCISRKVAKAVIPPKANRKVQRCFDRHHYRNRI